MKQILRWAWIALALGLLFDAFSTQIMYKVPILDGASMKLRIGFALGGLLGDIPAILIVGLLLTLFTRIFFMRKVNFRFFVVLLAVGCVINALIIHPIFISLYS